MRRKVLAAIAFVVLLCFAATGIARADVNDFTVTSFVADETLTLNDRQGQLNIVEKINVTFTDNNHGILRAIPASYKGQPLRLNVNSVTSETGAPTKYTKYNDSGNTVLKIGDPNRTVTGAQEYTIDYTLRNVIGFYNDHDELYWDVNGDQWQQPFTEVKLTLHLPGDAHLISQRPICYAGSYGSKDQNCTITIEGNTVEARAINLTANQTLSYVVGFQKGYFSPATFWQKLADHTATLVALIGLPLITLIGGFIWWYKRGRDAKGKVTIVPEYAPPEGLSPLEAGTVADFKVDNRDITATIIDLARRGYLQIIENTKDRKFLKDITTYSLVLKNPDLSALNPYEIQLMNALFTDKTPNSIVQVSDLKNKLYKTAADLRKAVVSTLTSQGYFRQNPQKLMVKSGAILLVMTFVGYVLVQVMPDLSVLPLTGGLIVALAIFFGFLAIMPARTTKGVAAREQLLGLKMYMEVAEKDRMQKLEGPKAAYAENAGEPKRTVELFEKLLPFAIVMGVETQWAAQFASIYTSPPDWYSGNWTAFNVGYLAGSLNSGFSAAINASFTPPSSSSSSGFGGGGFSGGGGGGGGGGGW